jgi:putative endonuclease
MSNNPQRRLNEHNQGKVTATKNFRPYEILLIEEFSDRQKAHYREKYYKTGFGLKTFLKKINS